MTDIDPLRRVATYGAVLAIVICVPSSVAFFAAFGGDIEAAIFGDPQAILHGGASAAAFLRWGAILDMFYSYLLLAPLALYLHRRLRPTKPWLADLATIAAFAYIVVGASAAAILASVGSSLVDAYSTAAPVNQPAIAISFSVMRDAVYFGLWQMLDPITAGIWIVGVGCLLLSEHRSVGRILVVFGIGAMGFSALTMLGVHSLAALVVGALVVALAAAAWVIISGRQPSASAEVGATSRREHGDRDGRDGPDR